MLDNITLFAIGLFAAALPGPDILYIIRSTLAGGLNFGRIAALGVLTASLIYLTLVGIGLGALGQNLYFRVLIGTFGSIYLLWIAVGIWNEAVDFDMNAKKDVSKLHLFFKGMVVHLSNPKAIIFFSVVLAPFLNKNNIVLQISILTMAHTTTFFGAVYLVSKFENFLTPSRSLVVNRIASILFVIFALELLWSGWLAILMI